MKLTVEIPDDVAPERLKEALSSMEWDFCHKCDESDCYKCSKITVSPAEPTFREVMEWAKEECGKAVPKKNCLYCKLFQIVGGCPYTKFDYMRILELYKEQK